METIENNKLLAEFMGFEWYEINKPYIAVRDLNGVKHFRTDWNDLMQVVEKIESLKDKQGCTFFVEISKERVHIKYYYKDEEFSNIFIHNYNGKTKIETVYKACIEFIKWYKENKQ